MKTIYKIIFLCILGLSFAMCSDDDNPQTGTPLELTVSRDTIILLESNATQEALSFSWNKGLDLGLNDTVSYIYRLDLANNNFETSTSPEVIDDFKKSYTTEEINNLIISKWGIHPGEYANLEARVVAKVKSDKFVYPEIATVNVIIQTYAQQPQPLFILGTATEAGMNTAEAIKLNEVSIGKIYTWKGRLTHGNFKFITTLETMLPSLNKGADDNTLVERRSEGDPDNYFTVTDKEGLYSVGIDRTAMKIVYAPIVYENMYIIGNSTSAEWDIAKAIEMQWDYSNPNVFTATVALKEGELKFYIQRDWGALAFRPLVANGSITSNDVQAYIGGEDLKWMINADQAGEYKITLDVNKMKIKFEKL